VKAILPFICAVALAAFATGCCTGSVIDDMKRTTSDRFSPSTIYRSKDGHDFAVAGTWRRYNSTNQLRRFLMVPHETLAKHHLDTNDLSVAVLGQLPYDLTVHLKMAKTLPPDYHKIADVPVNNFNVDVNEHHPGRASAIMLPFTVAADTATLPIQIMAILPFALAMSQWH
jgi:hypothetical protein